MKIFVRFLTLNTKGEIDDLLGSDGVFFLDGRNKLNTWIKDAHKQIQRLRYVQPDIVGFKIMKKVEGAFIGPIIYQWKDQDKIKQLRNGIKFNEDTTRKIPLKDIALIEMNSSMTAYKIHLKNSENIFSYRGTKTITFNKDYVEIM